MAAPKNKKFTPRASANLIEDEGNKKVTEGVEEEEEEVTANAGTTPEDSNTPAPVTGADDNNADEENTTPDDNSQEGEDSNSGNTTPDDEETPENSNEDESEGVTDPEGVDTTENEEDNSQVTFTAETNKKPVEKMVKIRLAKKFDGCIGGTWYHFAKDQVVTVPENVKRILNRTEGMLKPL